MTKPQTPINNNSTIVKIPIWIAIALVGGVLLGANFFGGQAKMNSVSKGFNKYREILSLIETSYVDSVDTDSLVEYSIKKTITSLL